MFKLIGMLCCLSGSIGIFAADPDQYMFGLGSGPACSSSNELQGSKQLTDADVALVAEELASAAFMQKQAVAGIEAMVERARDYARNTGAFTSERAVQNEAGLNYRDAVALSAQKFITLEPYMIGEVGRLNPVQLAYVFRASSSWLQGRRHIVKTPEDYTVRKALPLRMATTDGLFIDMVSEEDLAGLGLGKTYTVRGRSTLPLEGAFEASFVASGCAYVLVGAGTSYTMDLDSFDVSSVSQKDVERMQLNQRKKRNGQKKVGKCLVQ